MLYLLLALFIFVTIGLPLLGAFGASLFPKMFLAKYYDFPQVRIDATVNQDGSLSVVERRTFDFQKGSFSFAYREIRHRLPGDITDFHVSEGNVQYLPYSPLSGPGPLDPGGPEGGRLPDTLKAT